MTEINYYEADKKTLPKENFWQERFYAAQNKNKVKERRSKTGTQESGMMDKVPCHLGIIMDGNRRWAEENGLSGFEGHRKGAERIKQIARHCKSRGIKILTLYAFSTENWNRRQEEVDFLMRLFGVFLDKEVRELHRGERAKLLVIGQRERLPSSLQEKIKKAEELTQGNKDLTLVFAISYGGREEIASAIKKIIQEKISPDNVTEEKIGSYMHTAGLPDPDLIIRTSGEKRTSGFLLWQSAYSEWYFADKYWPDFSEDDLDDALREYQKRQRRFGK